MTAARRARLAVLPLLAGLLALTSCSLTGGGEKIQVTTYFDRAVSLYEQADVKVLGLDVGKVKEVEPQGDRIKVVFEIKKDVPVPADARAAIVPQSLIGERYVQLFPVWKEGQERLEDDATIPIERTQIPVEPDEALLALKEFLDTLDPDSVGRLIDNAAQDLDGNGANLGRAVGSLSELMSTLADKDDELADIVEQLDEFTSTLVTRESQIGRVIETFQQTTSVLAQERQEIEELVGGLARVSTDGLDLVSAHSTELRTDLDILARTLDSVEANLDSVKALLDSGPILVQGLNDAYNPEYHRIDLRNAFTPNVSNALNSTLGPLGIDVGGGVCIPQDVRCESLPVEVPAEQGVTAEAAPGTATPAEIAPARTPIDDVLGLLSPLDPSITSRPAEPAPSLAEQVGEAAGRATRFLRGAARTLLGVGG